MASISRRNEGPVIEAKVGHRIEPYDVMRFQSLSFTIYDYTKGVWREEGMQLAMYTVYAS